MFLPNLLVHNPSTLLWICQIQFVSEDMSIWRIMHIPGITSNVRLFILLDILSLKAYARRKHPAYREYIRLLDEVVACRFLVVSFFRRAGSCLVGGCAARSCAKRVSFELAETV
jgi:hypothetical protein